MSFVLQEICAVLFLIAVTAAGARAKDVHHYVFVGSDREKLTEAGLLDHKGIAATQQV
jgi:hypothetical protein